MDQSMMAELVALHPVDIPVALRLAEGSELSYQALSADLGISTSTAHAAVARLESAGLVRPGAKSVNWLALKEFLEHGLRYAFPARPGTYVRGVPTAHSGPALASHIRAEDALVWRQAAGSVTGQEIAPLYPQAVDLPNRRPSLYDLVTLADALRVGRVRERTRALEELERRLGYGSRAS
jgi:DNA-binding Lrp family transcriptional regulator